MPFSAYTPFTIAAGQVPTSQSNFTAILRPTDNRFRSRANGGSIYNAYAPDIRVYSDAALTTLLSSYLVPNSYDATTGAFDLRVKVTAQDGLTVYVAYGDPTVATAVADTAAWAATRKLVCPFYDGTTLNATNLITGGAGSITSATAVAGKVNGAAQFVSTDNPPGGPVITPDFTAGQSGARTWAFWAYRTGTGQGGLGRMFSQSIEFYNNGSFYWLDAKNWSGGNGSWSIAQPSANTWFRFVITYDNSSTANNPLIYQNGVSQTVTLQATPGGTNSGASGAFNVGNAFGRAWDGYIDEFEVDDSTWSQDRITADYNNQNAPNTFWSIGTEVPLAGTRRGSLLGVIQ